MLDTPFGKFARLQIITIEDLFAGKKPAMPWTAAAEHQSQIHAFGHFACMDNDQGFEKREVTLTHHALSFRSIGAKQCSISLRSPRFDSSFTLSHSSFRSF